MNLLTNDEDVERRFRGEYLFEFYPSDSEKKLSPLGLRLLFKMETKARARAVHCYDVVRSDAGGVTRVTPRHEGYDR